MSKKQKFDYQGKKYEVESLGNGTSYTFYEVPAGRGLTKLFTTELNEGATIPDFISEVINRGLQRQSVTDRSFHLAPRDLNQRSSDSRYLNAFENGRLKATNEIEAKVKCL